MDFNIRKQNRLNKFDYSSVGYYFITICTAEKKNLLCTILSPSTAENKSGSCVGFGVLYEPETELSAKGKNVEKQLAVMSDFYKEIKIDKYVIMPNHIHLIIKINSDTNSAKMSLSRCVGDAAPYNSILSRFVGTFKRYTNKSVGSNIWQKSFYDHIIRDENDYIRICEYIENNPSKWNEDKYYIL